ncbi:unnamed protein product [Ectocarpus sp. CCAP 1310/34]|nr:unnamed protein product [Ectocarpus sp. CCAP 1310/34]
MNFREMHGMSHAVSIDISSTDPLFILAGTRTRLDVDRNTHGHTGYPASADM